MIHPQPRPPTATRTHFINLTTAFLFCLVTTCAHCCRSSLQAAYTFDAGPNAVIYLLKEHVPFVLAVLLNHFPVSDLAAIVTPSTEVLAAVAGVVIPEELRCDADRVLVGAIGNVYHTSVGEGAAPAPADSGLCLADPATGLPL